MLHVLLGSVSFYSVRSLTHRATTITTRPEDLDTEMHHLRKVLKVSGYPDWVHHAPSCRKKSPHPSSERKTKSLGHVTLPYVGGVTEALSRKMRKLGITTHARPLDTIRRRLVAAKDKDDTTELCGVVYHLECANCDNQYIGETERPFKKRLSEPKRDSSPVGLHMKATGHHLAEDKTRILDRDDRWFQRGVREAIHIRSRSPSLNRDQGRHHLPRVYNKLLVSRDSSRPSGVSRSRDTNLQ